MTTIKCVYCEKEFDASSKVFSKSFDDVFKKHNLDCQQKKKGKGFCKPEAYSIKK